MRHRARLLLTVASLTVGASRGAAQMCSVRVRTGTTSCSINTNVSLTVPRVLQLTVSPAPTILTPPTTADFDAGFSAGVGPTVTVRANTAWTMAVKAQTATWAATNTVAGVAARTNKPSTDLLFSTAAAGPYSPLSSATSITTTGGATAGATQTEYYRVLWSWTLDTPGSYSISVLYTLTSP